MAKQAGRMPMLRKYLGDRRFLLMLPRAVGLQILHPSIASALVDHAPLRLWQHKRRTVLQMIYMAYLDEDTSRVIRLGHDTVTGHDDLGRRYHALYPKLFQFQHATYVDTLMTSIETFGRRLSDAQREQLYAECCQWYRIYGISDRGLPATWPVFRDYFEQACANELSLEDSGRQLAGQVLRPDSWIVRSLPAGAVRAMQHPRARELFDLPASTADRMSLRTVSFGVRAGLAVAPRRTRYVLQARVPH